jgi:type VI secretion system protein VasD
MQSINRFEATPDADRRRLLLALPALAVLPLAACTTAPRRTVPVTLSLEFKVGIEANPDPSGRPSPVLLSVYKLRKFEAFRALDYFSLSAAEDHAEYRLEEAFSMQPGADGQRSYTLEPEEIGFGVVAAYRDIERSQWRVSAELPPLKVSRIKLPEVLTRADPVMAYRIDVGRNSLALTARERA